MPNCTDLKSVLPEWTVHLDDACDAKNSPFERPIEFPLYSSYSFAFLPFLDESHYELITIVKNLDSSKHCSEAPSNSTSSWVKYVSYWFPLDPCSLSQWLGGGCQVQAMAKQYKWGTSFSIIVVLCEDMLLMDFSGNILSNSSLMKILMPVFPGQLRYIRKNLFHAVYVLDPASVCGLEVSSICLLIIWYPWKCLFICIIFVYVAESNHVILFCVTFPVCWYDYIHVWKQSPNEIWSNTVFYNIHQDGWNEWWWTPSFQSGGWSSWGGYIQFGICFF